MIEDIIKTISEFKEIGVGVNSKINLCLCLIMWICDNRNVSIRGKPIENASNFRYLGTTVANQKCRHEGGNGIFNSGNNWYHTVRIFSVTSA
jgi:hypothetical protein